jgi:hypothetical protein
MSTPTTHSPIPRKRPAKRLFSGVVGSPLSATAERKRGRPAKYATPEQAQQAETTTLRNKRQEKKREQEIEKVVNTSDQVNDHHLFVVGAGWALTGQENLERKSHRSATASPPPSPDDAVVQEDKINELQSKRDKLLSLALTPQLRWLLENASVDEIEEILNTAADPEQQSGGKRTPVADSEKLAEGATKVTGKGPKQHTFRGPEQSRMDGCLRDMVHSVIDLGEYDLAPRCTICDKPLDGLRGAWAEHLLEKHTTEVRRWFRYREVSFSPAYYGLK